MKSEEEIRKRLTHEKGCLKTMKEYNVHEGMIALIRSIRLLQWVLDEHLKNV